MPGRGQRNVESLASDTDAVEAVGGRRTAPQRFPVVPAAVPAPPVGRGGTYSPSSGAPTGDAVELYRRTYTTLLRSSGELRLRVFENAHRAMGSSLHPLAASDELDLGAFLYACRRLPESIVDARLVVMGQSPEVFARHGFLLATPEWRCVEAPGRRRRWYDDGQGTLAVLVASPSDVDDLVPTLVAFQIEWNKLHARLNALDEPWSARPEDLARCLGGDVDDWEQLAEVWGEAFADRLRLAAERRLGLRLRMLGGTQVGYARITRAWWAAVDDVLHREGLADRPVYFVSSNSHSIVNLLTATARAREPRIVAFVDAAGPRELREELRRFREGTAEGEWANFLYYAARLWFRSLPPDSPEHEQRRLEEHRVGVFHVPSSGALDVAAQVIVLDRLAVDGFDPRLAGTDVEALRRSPAVIVNIDYPLGLAAYNILREVAETVSELRGIYILGKAATLNADVGDVMISDVVHDEHSGCTFWLDNAFTYQDIAPFLRFGSCLDGQRAVTVRGTFLQNRGHLDFYYREAFTVVEMEAGPYCAAVYELSQPSRYPTGEAVNFSKLPVDFGIVHYASDTPFTQARTLGARGLSYHGMDSTYASSVAIVRRIMTLEGALSRRAVEVPAQSPGPGSADVAERTA